MNAVNEVKVEKRIAMINDGALNSPRRDFSLSMFLYSFLKVSIFFYFSFTHSVAF